MRPREIRNHKAFGGNWFHAIELAPDPYGRKPRREPVGLTRELLCRTDVDSGGVAGGRARRFAEFLDFSRLPIGAKY